MMNKEENNKQQKIAIKQIKKNRDQRKTPHIQH